MSELSKNIGKRLLKKRFKGISRDKSVQDFKSAKSAAIIFDAQMRDCFNPIKDFTKFLSENGIKSTIVGFVTQKEVPQEMLLWANYDFITKKEVNWFGKPKGEIADLIYNGKPDILFVFSVQYYLEIEFLVQLSKARFKVGCYTEEANDYDLMISPVSADCNADFFIEQVKHYIQLLNPSN